MRVRIGDVRMAIADAGLATAGVWFVTDMVTRRTVVDGTVQNRGDYRLWYVAVAGIVAGAFALSRSLHRESANQPDGLASLILTSFLNVVWIPLLLSPLVYVGAYLDESDRPEPVFVERPFNYFRGLLAILLLSAAAWILGGLVRRRDNNRHARHLRGNVTAALRGNGW